MTLIAGVVAERSLTLFFMATHALPVKSIRGRGNKHIHRFGMAVRAGLRFRFPGRGCVAGVAIFAPLDAFLIHIFMTIGAFGMIGLFQAQHVLVAFIFVAIGTGLGFRLDFFVVVAGLAVVFRVFGFVLLVGEFVDARSWMVTGNAILLVNVILVIGHEYFIEFFDVAVGACRGRLVVAGRMMASCAVLPFALDVRRMGKNDFAALVLQENTRWRTV